MYSYNIVYDASKGKHCGNNYVYNIWVICILKWGGNTEYSYFSGFYFVPRIKVI